MDSYQSVVWERLLCWTVAIKFAERALAEKSVGKGKSLVTYLFME